MKLTLQTLTGKKYFLEVKPQDKLRNVKVKIFRALGIKSKMHFLWQNKAVEDDVTLAAQGIPDDATFQMIIDPDVKIKVKIQTFKKGTLCVELEDSSTIMDFMMKIPSLSQLPAAHISDFYFEDVCLSNEKLPFHFYGITDGSEIIQHYQGSFRIAVHDAKKLDFSEFVTVQGTTTIIELKEKILYSLIQPDKEEECQVNIDDIVFFLKRKGQNSYDELDRDVLSISDCKIRPLDTIHFIRYDGCDRSINIVFNGQKRELHGTGYNDIVQSLCLKIQNQLQIPFEKQQLFYNGEDDQLKQLSYGRGLAGLNNIFIKAED